MDTVTQQTISTSLSKRVRDVAEHNFISLPENMLVGEAVRIMRDQDVSSILVSKLDKKTARVDSSSVPSFSLKPVGILTERDILYRVMAENKGPYKVTLGQIMSSPLITISENASVRDAIALMQSRQIRRLPVTNDSGNVTGLITLKTMIGNMPSHNIDLAEVESSRVVAEKEAVCPYCRSVITKGSTIIGHMEDVHMQKE
jgi:CBS domain-containing protein